MPSISHLLTRALAAQKSVFAHVVVGNTAAHEIDTWTKDINLAWAAGIDAFILNIAYPDSNIPTQVSNAFAAAEASNSSFKLAFSFDYLGGGQPWPANGDNSVVSYLSKYKDSDAYFKYQGKPFVSTFEGTDNTGDWAEGGAIKGQTGDLYFVPDWTSLGPAGFKAHLDKVDGAFSWDMWPDGPTDMTIGNDKAWQDALGGKSYMMGVSPWFFRSATGGKNWVWKGDDLWAYRWNQTLEVEPEFVQIVTWNDYGESHYIGPVHDPSEIPAGSAQFVQSNPHEGWLTLLPYYISSYKGQNYTVTNDAMQYWYLPAPTSGGATAGVVGGTGATDINPDDLLEDKVFVSALLKAAGEVHVAIGNNPATVYQGVEGINHWSQPFNGQTGNVTFSVVRGGNTVKSNVGEKITATTTLADGRTNYNAWVGGS